jgi:hypothetical protein
MRWTNSVECVFTAPDDGLVYRFIYQHGKTEQQEMRWYDSLNKVVECQRVEQVTVTTVKTKWLPVNPEATTERIVPADEPLLPASGYTTGQLKAFARNYADIPWMVHWLAAEQRFQYRDANLTPLTETDAIALAASLNRHALELIERGINPYTGPMRATVFHNGRPFYDEDVEAAEWE